PSAAGRTVATGINDKGQIVGYYTDTQQNHGFFLAGVGGGFDPLNDPLAVGFVGTAADGINDLGTIVGVYRNAAGIDQGFLTGDGIHYTTISDPLGTNGTLVLGTSNNAVKGLIYDVGVYVDSANKSHGFFNDFFSGTYTTIDDPLGTSTQAEGVN